MVTFDYAEAFSRNAGLIPVELQKRLRGACVGIAGMGGVGGFYVSGLARSGLGRFKLADFDEFELANFNRQYGASMSTVGRRKAEVMADLGRDINPEAVFELYPEGLTEDNLDMFLEGVDIVIDGIDLFVPDWHRRLIRAAVDRDIPVLAAVPVGFGAGMVGFSRQGMGFDEYFDWSESLSPAEKTLRLAAGFAPAGFHGRYIDPQAVSLVEKRGPSSVAGCMLCGAMVTTRVIAALEDPGALEPAPVYCHLDLKLNRLKKGRLRRGNRGALQRIKLGVARKRYL